MSEPLPPPGWYPDNAGAEPVLRWHRLDAAVATGTAAGAVVRGTLRTTRYRDHRGTAPRLARRSPHTHTSGRGARAAPLGRHAFHFVLTLLTLGVGLIFLILHRYSRFEKRVTLTVDPYGNVSESRIKVT